MTSQHQKDDDFGPRLFLFQVDKYAETIYNIDVGRNCS